MHLLRRYQEILSGSRGEGVIFTGTVSEREEVGPNKTDLGQQQQRYCAYIDLHDTKKKNR